MELKTLLKDAEDLVTRLKVAKSEVAKIKQRQAQLQAAGMADASPYWSQTGYLYITGRMRGGDRSRKYIGKDSEKVREALAQIERFKEHEELGKSLSNLTNAAQRIEYSLQDAHSALNPVVPRSGKANKA